MLDKRLRDFVRGPEQDAQHASGKASGVEQLGKFQRRQRRLFRWLENERSPSGDCRSDFVRNLVERMVEWGDGDGATQRLASCENLPSLALRGDVAGEDLPVI